MDDSPELAAHRAAVRAWLEQHATEAPRPPDDREMADAPSPPAGAVAEEIDAAWVARRRAWQRQLADAGLIGATWPVAHGGRGQSAEHARVIEQELEAAGLPGPFDVVGVGMVGPTIIAHGSPDQQDRLLRPLRQISGRERFSEVFLDDVRLEPDAVLGDVGDGWRVALDTLSGERAALSRSAESLAWRVEDFAAALAGAGAAGDEEVQRRFGEIACAMLALRWSGQATDRDAAPAGALDKITAVDAATRAGDLLVDVLGPDALTDPRWGRMVSELPGLRSAGGTDEIVRTLVGERALGLPREPRVDKGVPFSELPFGAPEAP